jgi:chromosome segregation ATPase
MSWAGLQNGLWLANHDRVHAYRPEGEVMSGSAALKTEGPNAVSREDLEAMFANLSLAHDAALKGIKTLEARNDHLGKTVKTLTKQRDDGEGTIAALRAKISNCEDRIEERDEKIAELKQAPLQSDEIEDLARVRALLKKGDVDRARDGLERVLDGVDNCWRTRAATLPGQGALL